MQIDSKYRQITFLINSESVHGGGTERLWAIPLPDGTYRLENTPFYAFGVSFEDIVAVTKNGDELLFKEVITSSGRSTYRLLPLKNWDRSFSEYWACLQKLGCTYEGGPGKLLAVDIPVTVDIYTAYKMMELGEQALVWSFEEGHCGHIKV